MPRPIPPQSPGIVIVVTIIMFWMASILSLFCYCHHHFYYVLTAFNVTITNVIIAIIVISTFSKVSVPVQNWALVVESWRRRRRRREKSWCPLLEFDDPPTFSFGNSPTLRGSRASSPLMLGTHLSHSESKEAQWQSSRLKIGKQPFCKYSVAEKKALGEKKMWSRSNYSRLRPVIFNNNAIDHKATILPLFWLCSSPITTKG